MRPGRTPEDRLREALRARADEVEPSPDALPRIRARAARAWTGRLWTIVGTVAAVATAIAAGVVAVQVNRAPRDNLPAAGGAGHSPRPSLNATTATISLPAYFTNHGRLYREFLPATAMTDEGRIEAAVELSLLGRAKDPDYRSLWPGTVKVNRVTISQAQVTVDLGGVGAKPDDPKLAVQQLLYTVAAAATYTSIKHADGIRLLVDGRAQPRLWGAVDTGGVMRPGLLAELQGPVWVIEPDEGAVVGKTFTVYLAGVVVEGTLDLRVRNAAGELVDERTVQLSAGAPALGEARLQLTLPAGRYTVEGFVVSEKDGSEEWIDDHDFTVG
ncbi:GerMN domain-containing protein [Dactylosporangium vinaceum]|uniref:Gmad2 immunoglobulin-like domain-containing protein n=1 Tax=Dactylosporangium vinaceum TaxID=53362 RepID=A0ABV5M8N2_9ACTN|nr:Gmad2 immunoglobulin-like domain-containing protein [Dactylosporangium vinaceum]UAB94625.1 GerMN domain-containing protein [Dactylosporangium vinaceum]